mmetsp:Transcript_5757/g.18403  ORF Transcript_5757/g.18403 Transcript_5757/m.18403 type:complete len:258 (+) Transcript_5757:433-1206(+)
MRGEGLHGALRRSESVLKSVGEHNVAELGLVIPLPARAFHEEASPRCPVPAKVPSILLKVPGLQWAAHPRQGRVRDDAGIPARCRCRIERGEEVPRELEVRKEVGWHLHVVAVLGGAVLERHDASVVAEAVNLRVLAQHRFGGGRHGALVLEIAFDLLEGGARHLLAQAGERRVRALRLAVEQDDGGSELGEVLGGHEAGARCGAGDDHGLARLARRQRQRLREVLGLDALGHLQRGCHAARSLARSAQVRGLAGRA